MDKLRRDSTGCMETICYCHKESERDFVGAALPVTCRHCGCRWIEGDPGDGHAQEKGPFSEADVISRYTREQAIEDGVLVNMTEWGSATGGFLGGFTCPVAFTRALWEAVEAIPESLVGIADVRGRAHDVLSIASLALRGAQERQGDWVTFDVMLPYRGTRQRKHRLYLILDRDGVTIGFPGDF
jgi:hypothetical protein